MFLPRFTLRTGLAGLTLGVLVAIVVREALLDKPWAIGVVVALVAAVLSLVLQAVSLGLSLLLTRGGKEPVQ
jgi:uncharacterized membrane protein YgaE (UPF0421/DUF939 family)